MENEKFRFRSCKSTTKKMNFRARCLAFLKKIKIFFKKEVRGRK